MLVSVSQISFLFDEPNPVVHIVARYDASRSFQVGSMATEAFTGCRVLNFLLVMQDLRWDSSHCGQQAS
jgi:hypothetical protein